MRSRDVAKVYDLVGRGARVEIVEGHLNLPEQVVVTQ